jgi:hypothetical protein
MSNRSAHAANPDAKENETPGDCIEVYDLARTAELLDIAVSPHFLPGLLSTLARRHPVFDGLRTFRSLNRYSTAGQISRVAVYGLATHLVTGCSSRTKL